MDRQDSKIVTLVPKSEQDEDNNTSAIRHLLMEWMVRTDNDKFSAIALVGVGSDGRPHFQFLNPAGNDAAGLVFGLEMLKHDIIDDVGVKSDPPLTDEELTRGLPDLAELRAGVKSLLDGLSNDKPDE